MNQSEKNVLEILRSEIRTADAVISVAQDNESKLRKIHQGAKDFMELQLRIKRQLQSQFDEATAQLSAEPSTSENKL